MVPINFDRLLLQIEFNSFLDYIRHMKIFRDRKN